MISTIRNSRSSAKTGRLRLGLTLAALTFFGLAACDPGDLLDVDDPDVVLPGDIEGPTALPAAHANAIADFVIAYVGNPAGAEGQAQISGLLADEFIHTGTFDTRESIDRRSVVPTNPHVNTTFRSLHRARVSAERTARAFSEFDPNTERHAEVQNLAGFTYVMFGENYCAGVPFSEIDADGELVFGDPETTTQVFDRAIQTFETALTTAGAAGSDVQQNLASLGMARALVGRGDYEAAAAAVAGVPTDFQYLVFHSETSARQNNGVWSFNNSAGRWSIADREGGNGLAFRSDGNISGDVLDPRVPTMQIGLAQRTALRDRGEHWGQLKYPERASSSVLATGIEARLIEAEAALRLGNAGVSSFVSLHNELRTGAGLQELDAAAVAALAQREREDLHFDERAYWLWLTSHRLGDLRRQLWDYGRQADEVFPIGTHHRAGAPYESDTNIPIAFDEQNNPQSVLCITRDDHQGRT